VIFSADYLLDKRILVTGASSGIGRATAGLVARCGARVALCGRDAARLKDVHASLIGEGHSVHVADLGQADAAHDLVVSLVTSGLPIDGVFHSAGMTKVLPLKLIKDRQLDEVFGANLRGAFGIARAAAKKGVLVDGGALLFMSSVAAVCGRPALASYCAAKAGLNGLVRAASVELAPRGIRVNAIDAGAVRTAMHDSFVESVNSEAQEEYARFHPLGFGEVEDIANIATYLLGSGGRWITGANLAVDGGAAAK
jgi:NAD(P)-dependent dehydrogenase (short-subunit alcohol dehydrogenase family)